VGAVLAEGVAGGKAGCDAVRGEGLGEDAQGGDGDGEDCRLRVLGELKGFGGAVEDEGGEREAEGFVGFVEDRFRCGEAVVELTAHPDGLRALTGKEEGEVEVRHRRRWY
jgi:hypothetical protein